MSELELFREMSHSGIVSSTLTTTSFQLSTVAPGPAQAKPGSPLEPPLGSEQ